MTSNLQSREYQHITDNNRLSFGQIKEMISGMFNRKIELQERHLSESVVVQNGQISNLSELEEKGIDCSRLQEYFSNIPGEYNASFDYIGENNLIPYESKGFFFDSVRSSGDQNVLSQVQEQIKQGLLEGTYLSTPAALKEAGDANLQICLSELDEFRASIHESDNLTIKDVIKSKFQQEVRERFELEENDFSGVVNSLCTGVPLSRSLLELKNFNELKELYENRKTYIQEFKQPLKEIINKFSNQLVKSVQSPLLPENANLGKTLFRHTKQISSIIENIKDERYGEFIEDALNLTEEDIASVSGVSFKYGNDIYNVSSKLETVKNMSSLFSEGNDIVPPVRFSIKTEGQKRVALFPGSFKPPHKGHFAVAEQLARTNGIDEVRVLISPLSRTNAAGTHTITCEQSLAAWQIMAEELGNIKPIISKSNSPVTAVYESLKTAKPHENFILTVGDKDNGSRFSGVDSFLQENNPQVRAEVYTSKASGNDRNVSATDLREALASDNKEAFYSFMPESLDKTKMNEIWNALTSVNEMSAMAGGSVEGGGTKKKANTIFVERQELLESINNTEILVAPKKYLNEVTDAEESPHASTGINVLRDLLKKIVPQIEQDYKTLTTSEEQRESFKSHLLKGLHQSLNRADMTSNAGEEMDADPMLSEPEGMDALAERIVNQITTRSINEWAPLLAEDIARVELMDEADLEIKVDQPASEEDAGKFIDIDGKKSKEDEESEKEAAFTIPGKDLTGRNMAQSTFDSIENTVLDSFIILSNDEDKTLFKDYLMANLKLYFERFEEEMGATTETPEAGDAEMQNTTQSADAGAPAGDADMSFGGI